jgi:S1-C subfamily serine protease
MKLEKQKTAAAVYQAEVQFSDVDMRYHLGKAEIAMKTVQANIELLKLQVQAAVAATGNIAQVSSTMVAGSLSALNANTSIGLTESYGNSYGKSDNTSKSTSTSQSTSVSTSYNHNYEE